MARKRVLRTASIIIGLIVVVGTIATGLMIWISWGTVPDGVYVEYPVNQHYVSRKPWTPPNGSFGLVFIDAVSYGDSTRFRESTWKSFLQLLRSENVSNLYVARVTCSDFIYNNPEGCKEETAKNTMVFYELLVYQAIGGGLAYPPSLVLVYNNGSSVVFVDLIVPKYPGPTDPFGIYSELNESMYRYMSQVLRQS